MRRPRSRWRPDPVQLDARKVRAGSTLSGDVCVIGAGAAGITVSRRWPRRAITSCSSRAAGSRRTRRRSRSTRARRSASRSTRPSTSGSTRRAWVLRRHDQPLGGYCRPFPATDLAARSWVPRRDGRSPGRSSTPTTPVRTTSSSSDRSTTRSLSWSEQGHLTQPFLEDDVMPHALIQVAGHPVLGVHVPRRDRGVGSDPVGAVEQRHAPRARRERRCDRPRRRRDAERQFVPRAWPGDRRRQPVASRCPGCSSPRTTAVRRASATNTTRWVARSWST